MSPNMKISNMNKNILLTSKVFILAVGLVPVGVLQYIHGKYTLSHVSLLSPLVGAFMLFWGILVKQKLYKNSFELFSLKKWKIALLLLIGLELIQLLLVVPRLSFESNFIRILYKTFFFFVIVGFTEELWFRACRY